jgi:hypothetical protein
LLEMSFPGAKIAGANLHWRRQPLEFPAAGNLLVGWLPRGTARV